VRSSLPTAQRELLKSHPRTYGGAAQVTHALQAMELTHKAMEVAQRGHVRGISTEVDVCGGLFRVDLLVTTVDGREVS